MKKFNLMTQKQITKATGGVVASHILGVGIVLGLATTASVGAGLASSVKKDK